MAKSGDSRSRRMVVGVACRKQTAQQSTGWTPSVTSSSCARPRSATKALRPPDQILVWEVTNKALMLGSRST